MYIYIYIYLKVLRLSSNHIYIYIYIICIYMGNRNIQEKKAKNEVMEIHHHADVADQENFTTQVTTCHYSDDSGYHAGTPQHTTSQVGRVITQMTRYHAGTAHHAGEYTTSQVGTVITQMTRYHAGTAHHAGEYTTSQVGTVITQMTRYHAGTAPHAGECHLAGGKRHHTDDAAPRRYRSPRR